jgi:hypothetical protein
MFAKEGWEWEPADPAEPELPPGVEWAPVVEPPVSGEL